MRNAKQTTAPHNYYMPHASKVATCIQKKYEAIQRNINVVANTS